MTCNNRMVILAILAHIQVLHDDELQRWQGLQQLEMLRMHFEEIELAPHALEVK